MEFTISTLMMIFFVIFLIISIWKIYAFLPNEQLADDDTTKESHDELIRLILQVIKDNEGKLNIDELFEKIRENINFDKNHYWRFNLNRLNQLLSGYYIKNPHLNSIKDIYEDIRD